MEQERDKHVTIDTIDEEVAPIFGEIRSFLSNLLQKNFPSEREEEVDELTREAILVEFENKRLNCFSIAQGAIEKFSGNEMVKKVIVFQERKERMMDQMKETAELVQKTMSLRYSMSKDLKNRILQTVPIIRERFDRVNGKIHASLKEECAEYRKHSRCLLATFKEIKKDFPQIERELTTFVKEKLKKTATA